MDPNSPTSNVPFQRQPPPKDVDPPRQRIDVACQRCRRRKIKCSGWTEGQERCTGCVKADTACEFVNRPSPIMVPQNAHSIPATLGSAGYSRAWSPSTPSYVSPRLSPHGSGTATHRRMSQPYHPYPPQQSPTSLYPSYVMQGWMPPQPEVTDNYGGTGFHHLLDHPSSAGRQGRPADSNFAESPHMIAQSNLAQRRLQREGSYSYGAENVSPLQSPMGTPLEYSPVAPRDDFGKLLYKSLPIPTNTTAQTTGQLQSQPIPSHMLQNNYTQPSRPLSSHQQNYFSHAHHPRQSYTPEFAVPRRPNLSDVPNQPSTSSIGTFSSSSTTQSSHSYVSTQSTLPSPNETQGDFRNDFRHPSPYKTDHTPGTSRPHSRASLTPQTLADHTQVQESLHGAHIEAAKEVLPVETENEVGVIEFLDTLPAVLPPQREN